MCPAQLIAGHSRVCAQPPTPPNARRAPRLQLATTFSNNVLDSTVAFDRLLTKKQQVPRASAFKRPAHVGSHDMFAGASAACLQWRTAAGVLRRPRAQTTLAHMPAARQVAGLPPSALARAAQEARGEGHRNATAEAGPWLFTLDVSSYS